MKYKRKKYSVVITTVNIPEVIQSLADNFNQFDRINDVDVLIIGDLKTPAEVTSYVKTVSDNTGLHVKYYDIDKQKYWLQQHQDLANIIPYNSDNRRNIGHLIAFENGSEIIIALDDDNYPISEHDYIAPFTAVGEAIQTDVTSCQSGWYNVCDLLTSDSNINFYPRGYPYSVRDFTSKNESVSSRPAANSRLLVKAGLWLGDPDIDALTRLALPITVTEFCGNDVVLAPGTMCPFNTQNTAIHRDLIPAFYYVQMGRMMHGQIIDRYGDIWTSYITQIIMHHMGDCIGFGTPLVNHVRNSHDLLSDLGQEYPGMILTNKLVDILGNLDLEGTDYFTATHSFASTLPSHIVDLKTLTSDEKEYIEEVCNNYLIWLDCVRRLS